MIPAQVYYDNGTTQDYFAYEAETNTNYNYTLINNDYWLVDYNYQNTTFYTVKVDNETRIMTEFKGQDNILNFDINIRPGVLDVVKGISNPSDNTTDSGINNPPLDNNSTETNSTTDLSNSSIPPKNSDSNGLNALDYAAVVTALVVISSFIVIRIRKRH